MTKMKSYRLSGETLDMIEIIKRHTYNQSEGEIEWTNTDVISKAIMYYCKREIKGVPWWDEKKLRELRKRMEEYIKMPMD